MDRVANREKLRQLRRNNKDSLALVGKPTHKGVNFTLTADINTLCGLVKNNYL